MSGTGHAYIGLKDLFPITYNYNEGLTNELVPMFQAVTDILLVKTTLLGPYRTRTSLSGTGHAYIDL